MFAWIVVAISVAAGCLRTQSSESPTATLAQSTDAQQVFQAIRHRWLLANGSERVAFEPSLQEFRARFPSDPLTRLANVYLAWIALERGDLETAESLAQRVRLGQAGTTMDLANLVTGATLCKKGKPESALDLLTPLVGKMIDPYAQSMLHERIVDATVQAHRWFEALAYMDDWLRSAEPHEIGAVKERVDGLLGSFPTETLEVALRTMKSSKGHGGYGNDIRLAVAARLSQVAIGRSDPRLARTVIESQGNLEALGDAGEALAHLASSGGAAPRIVDATIGMVLPPREDALQARAAEAVAGALEVLGPSKSTVEADGGSGIAPTDAPALITRDHHSITAPSRAPFDELAHEGAALIIGGFDADGALLASRFAESESISVLLLTAPSQSIAGARFTFVVGEREEAVSEGIMEAAGRGGRKSARVGGPALTAGLDEALMVSCEARPVRSGEPRFPLVRWRAAGVSAIGVAGTVYCAHDLFLELAQARYSPAIVVGPEALGVDVPRGYGGTVQEAKVGLVGGLQRDRSMEAWVRSHGSVPGWYASLGRDACLLARAAVAGLPKGTVADASQVAARRASVQRALESARADLWSTKDKGFEGARKLAREITY
jgi:hypothetical protein